MGNSDIIAISDYVFFINHTPDKLLKQYLLVTFTLQQFIILLFIINDHKISNTIINEDKYLVYIDSQLIDFHKTFIVHKISTFSIVFPLCRGQEGARLIIYPFICGAVGSFVSFKGINHLCLLFVHNHGLRYCLTDFLFPHAQTFDFWPTSVWKWRFFYLPDIGSESGVKLGSNRLQSEVLHSLTHFRYSPDVGSASDLPQYEDTLSFPPHSKYFLVEQKANVIKAVIKAYHSDSHEP